MAGSAPEVAAFEAALQHPQLLGGALKGMPFKHSACRTAPFGRLKVSVKPEIVALGLPAEAGMSEARLPPPDEHDASHAQPGHDTAQHNADDHRRPGRPQLSLKGPPWAR